MSNLYLNPELAGGADSGPIDGDNPPDDHGLGFNTTTGVPEDIGGGNFQWHFNEARISGRAYLTYDIGANHPGLVVGTNYRIRWFARNLTGNNYGAALNFSNVVDMDQVDDHRAAAPNSLTELFIHFRPTSVNYAGIARIGVGTTSNNVVELEIYDPIFVDLDAQALIPKTIPDAWKTFLLTVPPDGLTEENYHRNDWWYNYLGTQGYEGSMNDRELQFWIDQGP